MILINKRFESVLLVGKLSYLVIKIHSICFAVTIWSFVNHNADESILLFVYQSELENIKDYLSSDGFIIYQINKY